MKSRKNVLIDSRWAGNTGIGRLYQEVMNYAPFDATCEYVESKMGLGNLLTPLMLGEEIKKSNADVFYSPSFMPPAFSKTPFIFTVHDLMHLFYYSKLHKIYYEQVIARLAPKAKKIITVSHFSKKQLVDLLGIPEELIKVIYNGVDGHFLENEEEYESIRPYFLYVGNRRKNKNVPAMLTAFAKARIPNDFMFYLSGNADAELEALIGSLGIQKRVRFLGFIEEADLPKLYKGAHATLFASLMEGFGLPVIESMASGTPVLTSNTSSLPEIAGGAALCVDPTEISAIQAGIEKLVDDEDFYVECTIKGLERAREFSWKKTAAETWETILS
ncbi:glycosyltransferase family 4 protein [Algoriphagus aquimarinus]|uniref:Glycosyltransferase involved in cell wall bisynthesis n=1 Tax=Algoriphagus aquimarinus TaxID=237018 RepID=A0A1I1BG50_9BACT|nr:glycosyltransferase family 1 protein [Algoriphagus aquimarinus]SFB49251.1 Glycosyltransferase involved in cell wall bisynthesis [Algoriphagus aquimarinus]|tara:strand:+ start:203268 stop:204260 length:993 start_codon:yes stop_codon:yes gene_type:complete